MTTKKVFGYLRVSGKGQITGHGFKRQLEALSTYCQKSGYELVEVYKEQVSGTTSEIDRPEFTEMVASILRNGHGVDTIIVESLDRLAREYRIQEQLLIYLASKGISLISANTGENVTQAISADPMKKALIQIQGIFAELDKSLLVKKLRKSRERIRKETGKCEGRKGYKEAGLSPVLQEIRRLRRSRKGRKQRTYQQVAEELNQQGHTAANGSPFSAETVRAIVYRMKKQKS